MAKPKPPGEKKDIVLRVCVTQTQKDVLAAAAQQLGLDLTVWLRMVGLEAATAQEHARTPRREKGTKAKASGSDDEGGKSG